MVCIYCLAPESRVLDSRWSERYQGMRRRRMCPFCENRWTTVEIDTDQLEALQEMVHTLTVKVNRLTDGGCADTQPRPDPD